MCKLIFLFLICVVAYADDVRKPKLYKVNLDMPPEERWTEVIVDYKGYLPAIKEELRKNFNSAFWGIQCWLLEKIALGFPEEYAREMQGVAKLAGLDYCDVIGLNIFYDITNFNELIDHAGQTLGGQVPPGCTSIVAEDSSGRIFHGRNLDFLMPELLRDLSIIVEFTRGGKVMYSGLTFAYFSGILTGQKPNAFTLSMNARRSGWFMQTVLMSLYTTFGTQTAYGLRQVLETAKNYDEALEHLTHMPVISPGYYILAGTQTGEGVLITRDRMNADFLNLNVKRDRWFIVQTNFDHWGPDEDNRRTTAQIFLNETKHEDFGEETMLAVLDQKPVRNNLTITRTVMSANAPDMFYRDTVISEAFP